MVDQYLTIALSLAFGVGVLVYATRRYTSKLMPTEKPQEARSRQRQQKKQGDREVSWESVGGYDDVKKEIREYMELPLKNRELARKYGLKPPKGILLFGPPGCGKSLMMKALASESRLNFIYVNVSDIMSKWYGESEARLKELFASARKTAPCILFFDEIDTIGTKRESHTGDSVTPRLLSLMLSEIDGLQSDDSVIIVGSTNVPQLLDKALLRAGRFDKVIFVGPPDRDARRQILKVHCSDKPLDETVDLDKIADATERYSGADLANLCQEVARRVASEALEKGERKISMDDFSQVIKRYKPSITLQMLEDYEKFRMDFERRFKGRELGDEEESRLTLNSVGGYSDIKRELYELLEMQFKYTKLMEELNVTPIRGILLYGPPGVGKTMMSRALAKSLGVKLISLSGAEVMYKGYEGAVNAIKEIFNRARENKPSIILLDELDAIASRRNSKGNETSKVVNQILTEMDGIRSLKEVVIIATTNRIKAIDPALLRPGRFDKVVHVPLPNLEERVEIFKKYLGADVCDALKCEKLAQMTEGYSGADIAAVTREAKIKLLRERIAGNSSRTLKFEDLEEAIERVRPSIRKKGGKGT
nr:AAA family ATPase [Sulfodiicoccus acidiphilus]